MSSRPVTAPNLPVVACHDVVRDFSQAGVPVRVLHGVNCEIQAGELVLLTGPSGCGKTTLVSVIGGILSPTAGSVRVFGRPLESLNGRDLAAFRLRHFGFVFQQFHLLPGLTAVENAALPLAASGLPRREAIGRAAALLETLGLRDHLGKLPRALSGGQQQRVAIARALIHDPDLLICDEPTSALDSQAGAAVMALLRAVTKERHRSCIIVTHDPRIENLADRILRMEDGRLIPSTPIPCA